MTLNEMTHAMNATSPTFGTDYAGTFDISRDEAERIAERAASVAEFEAIWENENWWTDENAA